MEMYNRQAPMSQDVKITRRQMLIGAAAAGVALATGCTQSQNATSGTSEPDERIIDIHQHTNYHNRSDEALLHHQKRTGVTQTILLPGGRPAARPSTLNGKANFLQAAAGGFDTCIPIVR